MIEKCYLIPIQKECNSNCIFCISKSRFYNKDEEVLECNEKFIQNIFLLKKRGIKRFEITGGGEPFLNPNLKIIIETIKKIIPDSYIKVYTNGNILKEIGNIDELNISVVHNNSDINNQFMKSSNKISLEEKLIYFRKIYPTIKIRLSLPMIKGAIDSSNQLEQFISATKIFVDEYVVRTLYPNTLNCKELYVDFSFNNDKVVFERENDVSEFDGLLLWSDNNFYRSWELTAKRYLYSYLLLKPDSRTYVNEIENLIFKNGFDIHKITHIPNFREVATNFYLDKDLNFLELVKKHLDNIAYLFGNEGLLLTLDSDCSIEDLIKKTYDLKTEIRNRYSFTHNKGGFLTVGNNLSHLNLVHCPDNDSKLFDRDLEYMSTTDNPTLNNAQYSLIKRYRSYNI